MSQDKNWIEPRQLPGYRISRSSIQVTEDGLAHGALEPSLGRTRDGSLAYWIKPIGFSFSLFIKLEGLRRFFRGDSAQPEDGQSSLAPARVV